MAALDIAEILDDAGGVRFRYARRLSPDGTTWIRHGLFQSFHSNGQLSAEGHYRDGQEDGLWTTYHANGQRASQGHYANGQELPGWQYWDE